MLLLGRAQDGPPQQLCEILMTLVSWAIGKAAFLHPSV